jgi:mono/diheme cytochrome c family protein
MVVTSRLRLYAVTDTFTFAGPGLLAGSCLLALLASACSGSVSDPNSGSSTTAGATPAPVAPVAETCADNPLLAGCATAPVDNTPAAGPATDAASLAKAAAENVLASDCGQCHGPALTTDQAQAGMNYINDIDQLVATGKIVPLDSAGSLIIQRMEKGEMPPPTSGLPPATDADINTVASYIDNPVFWPEYAKKPVCKVQPFIDFDTLYHQVTEDLVAANADDAKFFRYISLTNASASGCDDTSLTQAREGVAKMLNMLSIKAQIGQLTSIEPTQTIYRMDLRDFKWDRSITVDGKKFNDVWDAVAGNNPYAIEFVGRDANLIKTETGAKVPIMFGDQMLHVATVGDLYYTIIGLDTKATLGDFVKGNLGIDVQGDIQQGDAIRAGTTKSRVSRQDRLVERHDMGTRAGVLWESFDFDANSSGSSSMFSDPFGFVAGATDAIFTLPNGMLAFAVADQNGKLQGESDILLDTSQADFRAVNSVSCSNCHALGFIPVVDEVKAFVESDARQLGISHDQLEELDKIYVAPDVFAQQASEDSKSYYQNALSNAGLPTKGIDPVSATFLRFEGDVDPDTAAADLGLTTQDLTDNIELVDPVLAPLKSGSTVPREDFTRVFVATLCRLSTLLVNVPNDADCQKALAQVKRGQ